MLFNIPFTEHDVRRADQVDVTPAMIARATYVGIQALLAFSNEYLNPILQGGLFTPSDRDNAILALYWRVIGLLTSIYALNGAFHFQSIASASRSLFELYLDLALLIRDPTGDSVDRFHAFTRVERFRVAEKIVEFFDAHPTLPTTDLAAARSLMSNATERTAIEGIVDHFWGRDKNGKLRWPKHWSQYDARGRAKALGTSFEALYVRNWYELSWHVHPGSVGVAGLSADAFDSFNGLAHRLVIEASVEIYSIVARELHLDATIEDLPSKLTFLSHVWGFRLTDLKLRELGEPERFNFLDPCPSEATRDSATPK
jgi:hypothetical protein